MKKSSFALILALGLALSPLCALDSSAKLGVDSKRAVQISSLSSADADFLFASNANLNVVALSDTEMNLTQGEFFGWLRKLIKPNIGKPIPYRPYK
ncbi:hypothetical protein [Helicobacter japonicus]|uniref:Uncharacterized protein n=2 Tax=Helicobacter japonicus TaxID=425400 RepID=A0A4U8TMT0_9HELI|nr:hypothetical protein [Helicobacter japonicus]TLE01055.1 hypothetical protein LS65_007030 [Helicobacter japonicus]